MAPSSRRDPAAVTSVLGVVLIIIVSLALAGAIWVMIDKIRQTHPVNTNAVQVVFRFNGNQSPKTVSVTKVSPPNLDWFSDMSLTGTCRPTLTLNGAAFPSAAGTKINAGDVLSGCSSGQTLAISSSSGHGNELLFSATF
jgi:hypothetical protein